MATADKRIKSKMPDDRIIIEKDDDFFGAVLNCSVRYCIGRSSYMPGLVIDYITPLLPKLSDKTLWCFEKDVSDAVRFGNLGNMNIDAPKWYKFLNDVRAEKERRKQNEQTD